MPAASADLTSRPTSPEPSIQLPFPPVTTSHILHCSYHFWHPLYRAHTPKARLLPLPPAFLTYLRADGIVLPPSPSPYPSDPSSPLDSDSDSDSDSTENADPSLAWPDLHASILTTIASLGGSITPKLNWSAPQDATWIAAGNSMECRTPNEVYLLLKASDFITHDLEAAFEGCSVDDAGASTISAGQTGGMAEEIPYTLVLRKTVRAFNPACEFRCFVRARRLLCWCQRDGTYYAFLRAMVPRLRSRIQTFFDAVMRDSFPDADFVFDVYVPPPHGRVWLVDVNPWAVRTDALLFGWGEVLSMGGGEGERRGGEEDGGEEGERSDRGESEGEEDDGPEEEEEVPFRPEVRLVGKDDAETYRFGGSRFGAHKLPRDVVDASRGEVGGEGGLREFMGRWRDIVARQDAEEGEDEE